MARLLSFRTFRTEPTEGKPEHAVHGSYRWSTETADQWFAGTTGDLIPGVASGPVPQEPGIERMELPREVPHPIQTIERLARPA